MYDLIGVHLSIAVTRIKFCDGFRCNPRANGWMQPFFTPVWLLQKPKLFRHIQWNGSTVCTATNSIADERTQMKFNSQSWCVYSNLHLICMFGLCKHFKSLSVQWTPFAYHKMQNTFVNRVSEFQSLQCFVWIWIPSDTYSNICLEVCI